MSEKLWSYEQLVYHSKSEDPEVRYWAVERLVRDYPERAAGPIAILLLDDHDQTPNLVAEHLGRYGSAEHFSILTRAFRRMGGQTPAWISRRRFAPSSRPTIVRSWPRRVPCPSRSPARPPERGARSRRRFARNAGGACPRRS